MCVCLVLSCLVSSCLSVCLSFLRAPVDDRQQVEEVSRGTKDVKSDSAACIDGRKKNGTNLTRTITVTPVFS